MAVTIDDQIREAQREINLRSRVYPKWVDGGRLKKRDADHRLACMYAILDTLTTVKEQSTLFGRIG